MSLARRSSFTNDRTDMAQRLDRSDFVVGQHNSNQHGVGTEGVNQIIRVHDAVPVNRQARDFPTSLFQSSANTHHRWMLDSGSDDVPAMSDRSLAQAANRKVVCFSAPG